MKRCQYIVIIMFCLTPIIAIESNSFNSNSISEGASGTELKTMMIASSENLSAYKYLINGSHQINLISSNPDEILRSDIRSLDEGAINLSCFAMSKNGQITIFNQNNITSEDFEIYINNETISFKSNNEWTQKKIKDADEFVQSQNVLQNQSEMLNESQIRLLGFEEIDGQECYRVQVKPSIESFATVLFEGIGAVLPLDNIDMYELYNKSAIAWDSWITKEDHLLKKNDVKIMFVLPSETFGITGEAGDQEIQVNYSLLSLFNNMNNNISIVPSEGYYSAYPFPLIGSSGGFKVTIFGVIQDSDANQYEDSDQIIHVDLVSSKSVTANLIDIDDRYYEPEYRGYTNRNERGFLIFHLPYDVKIKKIRFKQADSYGESMETPFSLDLRLDDLGQVVRTPIEIEDLAFSEGDTIINLYKLSEIQNNYNYESGSSHLVDFKLDIKITNNGTSELPLDYRDFSLIDQYDWEYAAKNNYGSSNLGILLPGESRRFDIEIEDVSEVSNPKILKYMRMRMNLE